MDQRCLLSCFSSVNLINFYKDKLFFILVWFILQGRVCL